MELSGKRPGDDPEACNNPRPAGPKLSWVPVEGVAAAPEGSAYAEFWLNAPGWSDPQRALAGVVAHVGPVLEKLTRPQRPKPEPSPGDDPAAAAK